ncbi:hypothetical protein [Nocardioides dongxiaopingii]|uniref:hypothetical protein n=1 Tax=Nocardioides dongxiaopingii TaxID=2576036 RepID=UPI0010C76562|nr:hypothetical protein [Nocardioides dongxiaopingii]
MADAPDLGYDDVKRGAAPAGTPPGASDVPADPGLPAVALRLVTTYDDRTRRVDIALAGEESVAIEDGEATPFPTARLWPVVRALLPPVGSLTADPEGRPATDPRRPGPTFAADCRAFVALATVVDEAVSVRTWLATDDDLWSVAPQPDGSNDISLAPDGAVADLLVWDVTAALESLVHRHEQRAS